MNVLDAFAVFLVCDWITFGMSSFLFLNCINVLFKFMQCLILTKSQLIWKSNVAFEDKSAFTTSCLCVRWCIIVWMLYRFFSLILAIYRIRRRLNKKKQDVSNKHFRLFNKLSSLNNKQLESQRQIKEGDHNNTAIEENGYNKLTCLPLREMRARLRGGQLTAIDLLDAFQTSAINQWRAQTNCVAEVIYDADVGAILADEALANAATAGADMIDTLTPLHGIPISLKEMIPISGYDHTFGYIRHTGKPAKNDSNLVKIIKAAGAVPFVLTNGAQMALRMDTWNPVFGRPVHPTHPNRQVGASSGGEGALLARNCSPIGIGTDLLGSVRFPIAFCGGCSLKPTTKRISIYGADLFVEFSHLRSGVYGPMGHRVDDLADVMRVLYSDLSFKLDASLPKLPFNETVYNDRKHPLRIGYFLGFPGLAHPVPSVERAVLDTKAALERMGHQLIEFTVPSPAYFIKLSSAITSLATNSQLLAHLYAGHDFDIVDGLQRAMHLIAAAPIWSRQLFSWLVTWVFKESDPLLALQLTGSLVDIPLNVAESMSVDYETEFFAAWDELQLDVCLSPVTVCPAPQHGVSTSYLLSLLPHCALYNMVNAPAGAVTVSTVTRADELAAAEALLKANKQSELVAHGSKVWRQLLTDQVGSQGLPLAVQIAAKPWNDELVLRVMKEIEETRLQC